MIFLKAIGIALLILALLVAVFCGVVSLLAGFCNELEHEEEDESLDDIEKRRDGK